MQRSGHRQGIFQGFVRSLGRLRRPARARQHFRLGTAEALEDRTLLTDFIISNISDNASVDGSLRHAINAANANPGFDTIEFDPEFFFFPRVITLSGTELTITDTLFMTGPGADKLTIDANHLSRIFNINSGDDDPMTVLMSGLKLTGGNSTGSGGAIYTEETLQLFASVVTGNTSAGTVGGTGGGGAIYSKLTSGELHLSQCTISGNITIGGFGGGVYSSTSTPQASAWIDSCTFVNNRAVAGANGGGGGGGLAVVNAGSNVLISQSTFNTNRAQVGGGIGLLNTSGSTTLEFSTISGNSATLNPTFGFGGGVYSDTFGGYAFINGCIIAGNTSNISAPDLFIGDDPGQPAITYSLIGNNKHFGPEIALPEAQTADADGNLVGSETSPIDPQLGPLAANGSAQPQTMALLSGSKAIAAGPIGQPGIVPAADQRGLPRPLGSPVDIGAYQTQGAAAPAAPTNLTLASDSDSGTTGDNVTNHTTPHITGNAKPGTTVTLKDGTTTVGTAVANGGFWSITTTVLGQGSHTLTATATDSQIQTSPASTGLTITVDSVVPTKPQGLTLDPDSDSGTKGDGITNFDAPTITGTAEANSLVTLKEGSTILGTITAGGGTWAIAPDTALNVGTHTLTATATDTAGNVSILSNSLTITIIANADTDIDGSPTAPGIFKAPVDDNSTFVVNLQAGVLDTFHDAGDLIVNLPIDRYLGDIAKLRAAGELPATVKLQLAAFDVDSNGSPDPERDRISINGHSFAGVIPEGEFLTGSNNLWKLNTFSIPIEWLNLPVDPGEHGTLVPTNNQIKIEIDTLNGARLTSIDWVSVRINAPNPVLLIHGELEDSKNWNPVWKPGLTSLGVPVATVEMGGLDFTAIGSLAENANKIAGRVQDLQTRWGFSNITLVAQGKGGIDARQYVEDLLYDEQASNDALVSALFMIGTENAGAPALDKGSGMMLQFISDFGFGAVLGKYGLASGYQFGPEAMQNYNAVHSFNPNTKYYSLAGNYIPGSVETDPMGRFMDDMLPGVDDSIVQKSSVWALDYDTDLFFTSTGPNGEASHFPRDNAQPGQIGSPGIYQMLLPLVLDSGNPPVIAPSAPAPSPVAPPEDDSDNLLMPVTSTIAGLVFLGTTQTQELTVDGGTRTYIMVSHLGGDLDVTLVSPSGVEITPELAESDPDIFYTKTTQMIRSTLYELANPEGGVWQVKVHANSVDGMLLLVEPYLLNAWFPASHLHLQASVDQPGYTTGNTITITANLQDGTTPVTGATVNATVFNPAYEGTQVPLFDDGTHGDPVAGDGQYTNTFNDTTQPGSYNVRVTATGTASSTFDRQEATLALVGERTGSLTNSFSASTVDLNVNSLADQLIVHAGVNITSSGFFRFVGELRDSHNTLIDHASFAGNLTPSTTQIDLVFDGRKIFDIGVDGPYTLSLIRMGTDSEGFAIPLQELENAFQTDAYSHLNFEHDNIAATILTTDQAVDSNSNELFDVLNLSLGVNLTNAGFYEWSAEVVDHNGHQLGIVTGSGDLPAGANMLPFSLIGLKVGLNGVDGPYVLTDIQITGATDAATIPQSYATQFYRADQFEGFAGTVPATPTNLDLVAASDTGRLNNDDFTGDNTPTFTVTAEAGVTVKFFVNGTSVNATETSPGVYSVTLAAGIMHLGSNTVAATATNEIGTSTATPDLIVQLAENRTATVPTDGNLTVHEPNGSQVNTKLSGKAGSPVSAKLSLLANDQFAEITDITVDVSAGKAPKDKLSMLEVSATGGTGFVGQIRIQTALLQTLKLANVSVAQINASGSVGTVQLTGTSAITTSMTITTNLTALQAEQLNLEGKINVGGNLGLAKLAGAKAGSQINVAKNLSNLDFGGNSNIAVRAKKIKLITSHGIMDGSYTASVITTLTSTGAFHANLGSTKVAHLNVPPT